MDPQNVTTTIKPVRSRAVIRRRRLGARSLAIGSVAGIAVTVTSIVPAQAVTGYSAAGTLNVRSSPSTGAAIMGRVPSGAQLDIDCQTTGTNIYGSTVWDKLNEYGGGYVSDYYVNGTPYAVFDSRIPRCGSTSPTSTGPPGRHMGVTVPSNYFPWGWCTWGAQNYQHSITGYYVDVWGNAYQWAAEAASKGWSVSPWNAPQPRSLVVWQPGVQGTDSTAGHVAYVDAVSGSSIHLVEMNGWSHYGGGFGRYDSHWDSVTPGMSFILLP